MKLKDIAIINLALITVACSQQTAEKYESFDETKFISEFPDEGNLDIIPAFNCDEIGNNSIKIIDSLLVVGHFTNWSIYNINNLHKYGECLSVGEGPGEFAAYIPNCTSTAFIHESDSIIAYVPDANHHRIDRLNLSDFINTNKAQITYAIDDECLAHLLWGITVCDGTSFLMAYPNETITGFSRQIYNNGTITEAEVTKSLSAVTVEKQENANVLAKVTSYNHDTDMFVEAMVYMNQINIYSKDGKSGKIICVGDKLDDAADIEYEDFRNRCDTYESVTTFKLGFGAIFAGKTSSEMQEPGNQTTEIQFFDWDGNPIYKAHLAFIAKSFDIDFNSNTLYAINKTEDTIVALDATNIAKAYNKK